MWPGSHCQESLGNRPRENSRLGWVTKGSLAWKGRKTLWVSRRTPHLSKGEEKGRPQWVPSVFQNVLKDEAQRVLGRHKICWDMLGVTARKIQGESSFLQIRKGHLKLFGAVPGSHITTTPNGPHQWPGCLFTRSKQRWNPL